ncbi:MAG: hypothetical protein FWC22_03895 [Treponema sp.]|nr:hypothetical protein [Treponema sp.]
MKNIKKIIGIITLTVIIGLSMTACDGDNLTGNAPPTAGKLTINGLSDYNGKYVYAEGDDNENYYILARDLNLNSETIYTSQITNGNTTLNVWKENNGNLVSYNGSGNRNFWFIITTKAILTSADFEEMFEGVAPPSWLVGTGLVNPNFSNGTATATPSAIESY